MCLKMFVKEHAIANMHSFSYIQAFTQLLATCCLSTVTFSIFRKRKSHNRFCYRLMISAQAQVFVIGSHVAYALPCNMTAECMRHTAVLSDCKAVYNIMNNVYQSQLLLSSRKAIETVLLQMCIYNKRQVR